MPQAPRDHTPTGVGAPSTEKSMRHMLLMLALAGCQEPFGTDRHDLVGVRIAALTAAPVDGGYTMRSAVVLDGRMWSDEPPAHSWHLLPDDDVARVSALHHEGAIATGPGATVDASAGDFIALVLTFGDHTRRAVLQLKDPAPIQLRGISLLASPHTIADVTYQDLELNARRALELNEPIDSVPVGGFARMRLDHNAAEQPLARWMLTAPGGTFYEVDRTHTDWLAGTLLIDDEEITEREEQEPGPHTVVVVTTDLDAPAAWTTRDFHVGDAPKGLFTTSNRWLGGDVPEGQIVQATLAADDDAPTGLSLIDAVAVELGDGPDPWGTERLNCTAPTAGPFDPTWLLEYRCTRAQVVGQRVLVERR